MKISSDQLRQIIKEEINSVINEQLSKSDHPTIVLNANGDFELHNVSDDGQPKLMQKDIMNPKFYDKLVSMVATPIGRNSASAIGLSIPGVDVKKLTMAVVRK